MHPYCTRVLPSFSLSSQRNLFQQNLLPHYCSNNQKLLFANKKQSQRKQRQPAGISSFLLLLLMMFLMHVTSVHAQPPSCNKEKVTWDRKPVTQPNGEYGHMTTTTTVSDYEACDVGIDPDSEACKCPCGSKLLTLDISLSGAKQCLQNPTPPAPSPPSTAPIEFRPNEVEGLWGWWDASDTDGDDVEDLLGESGHQGLNYPWDTSTNACVPDPSKTTRRSCEGIFPVHDLTSWADKSGNGRHFECPDALDRRTTNIVDMGPDGCNIEKCNLCEGDCDNDAQCSGPMKCFQRGVSELETVPGCGTDGMVPNHDYCYSPHDRVKVHGRWMDESNAWKSFGESYGYTLHKDGNGNDCDAGDHTCCPNGKDANGADKCIWRPICPVVRDRRWTNVALHRPAVAKQSYSPDANYGALKATDGNALWYNDQTVGFYVNRGTWIRIDLGNERRISHVRYVYNRRSSLTLRVRIGNNKPHDSTGVSDNLLCGDWKSISNFQSATWMCDSGEPNETFMRGRWLTVHSSGQNWFGSEIEAFELEDESSAVPMAAGSKRPRVSFQGYNMMTLPTTAGNIPAPYTIISVARYSGQQRGRLITSRDRDYRYGFSNAKQNIFYAENSHWGTRHYNEQGKGFTEDGAKTGPLIMHSFMANTTIPWEMDARYREYRDNFERPLNQRFYTNGIETGDKYYSKWQWNRKRYTGPVGRLQLGARSNTFSERSNGEIAELMIFNRNISTAERKGIERYLANKWDLVAMKDETNFPEFVDAEEKRNKTCSELNWPDMSSAAVDENGQDCHGTKDRGDQYCTTECMCGDEDGYAHGDPGRCKRGTTMRRDMASNPKYGFPQKTRQETMCMALPGLKEKLRETCARGDGCDPMKHKFLESVSIQDTTAGGATSKLWYGTTSPWPTGSEYYGTGTNLASYIFGTGGKIWRGGVTNNWLVDTIGVTENWFGIASSSDGTKLAAVVNGGNIWRSTDAGINWIEDTSVGTIKSWNGITTTSEIRINGDATTVNNNAEVTLAEADVNIVVGAMVSGIGIAAGTTVAAIEYDDTRFLTLSKAATSSGTNILTFDTWELSATSNGANIFSPSKIWTSEDSGVNWCMGEYENRRGRLNTKVQFCISSEESVGAPITDGTKLAAGVFGTIYQGNQPADIFNPTCDERGCPSPATEGMVLYSHAVKYCESQEARLCSFQELYRGEAQDSGCIKYQKIWSLNRCNSDGDAGRWATTQSSKKYGNVIHTSGNLTKCLKEDSDTIEGELAFPMCCSSKVPNAKFDEAKTGFGWASEGCPGEMCVPSCMKTASSWEFAEKIGMCATKGECDAKSYLDAEAKRDCANHGFDEDGLVLNWMVTSHMFPNKCSCDCRTKNGINSGAGTSTTRRPRDCERHCSNGRWTGGYRGFAALNIHGVNVDGNGGADNPYNENEFHHSWWEKDDVATNYWEPETNEDEMCNTLPTTTDTSRSQPREQQKCLWKTRSPTEKWGTQTGTQPWPAPNGDMSANTLSGDKRKCNGWWGYGVNYGPERQYYQERDGCACHRSGLEYHFENSFGRKIRLDSLPVLGQSVALEDGVTLRRDVAPGEPTWVNYIDNGMEVSRCGGARSGKNINLYCHYQKWESPREWRYFRGHSAAAATYVYSVAEKTVMIRFRAAYTGILYLNGVFVPGSDQFRDSDSNMNRGPADQGNMLQQEVTLQKGQNWFLYDVNHRDPNLGFVLYFMDTEGLAVSTVALDEDVKPEQCVPTPHGFKEKSGIPSTPVDRAQCKLCGEDFYCYRNQLIPDLEFIDPLRSDSEDPVAQREITKLMIKVKGDFGIDGVTDIDLSNQAEFFINDYSMGSLQGTGTAKTWQCNTCFETERFGQEMKDMDINSYQYFDRDAPSSTNGKNTISLKLPEKYGWCISNIQLLMCAKPGPAKITAINGINGADPTALDQRGGEVLEIIGQNLGPNSTFIEVRYGPDGKQAFKIKNCTLFAPRYKRMLCSTVRGVGGPYKVRVLTDTISDPSPDSAMLTYKDPVLTLAVLTSGGTELNSDGNNLVMLKGEGILPSFTDASIVTMTVVTKAQPDDAIGVRGAYAEADDSGMFRIFVPIGAIGSTPHLATTHPSLAVQYSVKNSDQRVLWHNDVADESKSNFFSSVSLVYTKPDIKYTYLTFDQTNATSLRTNLRVQIVGTGFCATTECCKLQSCDEAETRCIFLTPMTPQDGLCAEEGLENECSPKIDGFSSRQFLYPEGETSWQKRKIRLLAVFNSTDSGDERLTSEARIIQDKNPEFSTYTEIEVESTKGEIQNISCKYVMAATITANLRTVHGVKLSVDVLGFYLPSDGSEESIITMKFPAGVGETNRFWIENSGQPSRPRVLKYKNGPSVDSIELFSDPTFQVGASSAAAFIVKTTGDEIIIRGSGFGPGCIDLEIPNVCTPASSGPLFNCVPRANDISSASTFCDDYNCEYDEIAHKCRPTPSKSLVSKTSVVLTNEATNITRTVELLEHSHDELKATLFEGENAVYANQLAYFSLKMNVGGLSSINKLDVRYYEPKITSIAQVERTDGTSGGLRTDGKSKIRITGSNFGSMNAHFTVLVGTSPPRECVLEELCFLLEPFRVIACRAHDYVICNLPEGSGQNVPVNLYVSGIGLGDVVYPKLANIDAAFTDFSYDAPVIKQVTPSKNLPTSGYYYTRLTPQNSATQGTKVSVAGIDITITKQEKAFLEKEYSGMYKHMSKEYVLSLLRDNIEQWAERATITILGDNFGPTNTENDLKNSTEKYVALTRCGNPDDEETCVETRIDSFIASNHTHLIFYLAGGTGIVKLDVFIKGQKQVAASTLLEYAPPNVHEIEWSDDNGDFSAPTSGCAEYGMLPADSDTRPCKRLATMILHGSDFGSELPDVSFSFLLLDDKESIIVKPISGDHYQLLLNIPAGAGEGMYRCFFFYIYYL